MSVSHIAQRLVAYCRRGDYVAAQRELYAEDAVSADPADAVHHGLRAIEAKTRAFTANVEIHGRLVSDPIVADAYFACVVSLDFTDRRTGIRRRTAEFCVYEVRNAKIVREQYFYQAA